MKFLAMLKDSLRETLDVKLFHVLVGLSALVVLFVFSITYKPMDMAQQLQAAKKNLTPEFMNRLCRDKFDLLDDVHVEEGEALADEPNVLNFTVTSHGSKIKTAKGWFYRPSLFFGLLPIPDAVVQLVAI